MGTRTYRKKCTLISLLLLCGLGVGLHQLWRVGDSPRSSHLSWNFTTETTINDPSNVGDQEQVLGEGEKTQLPTETQAEVTSDVFDSSTPWGHGAPHNYGTSLLGKSSSEKLSGRWAVVSVYVDHVKGAAWKDGSMLIGSLIERCSAMLHGSQAQFILLHIYLEEGPWADLLRSVGWHLRNMTSALPFLRRIYRPIYTQKEAKYYNRTWPNNTNVQPRRDGWATYLKYFAWLEHFERVLVSDTDVIFKSNPDRLLENLRPDKVFLTLLVGSAGRRGMGMGIHSFFHMVRPSTAVFDDLVIRSRSGDYLPWTNGEQDVLEAKFPPLQFALDRVEWKNVTKYSHSKKRFSCRVRDVQQWNKAMTLNSFCQKVVKECWDKAAWWG